MRPIKTLELTTQQVRKYIRTKGSNSAGSERDFLFPSYKISSRCVMVCETVVSIPRSGLPLRVEGNVQMVHVSLGQHCSLEGGES